MLKHLRIALCLLLLFALNACGGGSSNLSASKTTNTNTNTNTAVISGTNVAPVIVDAGPAGLPTGQYTVNEVFTNVTICDSLNNCQTIDHILVDTGSSGLRIISSVLSPSLSLTQQTDTTGNPIGTCGMFVDGYTWGPVKLATVKLADQTAPSIPIQVIGDPNFNSVPTACANTGKPENTVADFRANGVVGVGYFKQDCGSYCTLNANANAGIYYSCTSSSCTSITMPLAQQLANPVSQFASDNNGVMLSLPSLGTYGDSNVAGSLVLGVNTQTNNDMSSSQILTVSPSTGYITTVFNGQALSKSFIDSGSNGLYFSSTTLPICYTYFYCPSTIQNYTAIIQGNNATRISVNFNVANATTLFNTYNTAFYNLAGTGLTSSFDWGLPFFYGRKVFVVMEGENVGGSTGPFIAF